MDLRDEWKQKLISRYKSSVYVGIDCNGGWRPLIEYLYDEADKLPCVSVSQVKEKFGQLRFYTDHDQQCEDDDCGEDKLQDTIGAIECLSSKICEKCGAYGILRGKESGRRWIKTLCEDCNHSDRF